jgi:2-amino-4-hydroxy-6-hydroxymethyldihydropteridine diphosphokinase
MKPGAEKKGVTWHTAFISAGSNLGDKLRNCRDGIRALTQHARCRILGQSRIYHTEPLDYRDQDWFINLVVKIKTDLDPFALLAQIIRIQRRAGRLQDAIRFGPRILDLDILLFDDLVIRSPDLTIPHPRMHQRRFVLKPICDIDPLCIHPVLKLEMISLLHRLDNRAQKVIEVK